MLKNYGEIDKEDHDVGNGEEKKVNRDFAIFLAPRTSKLYESADDECVGRDRDQQRQQSQIGHGRG